jgi:hypothetical protein
LLQLARGKQSDRSDPRYECSTPLAIFVSAYTALCIFPYTA